MSQVTGHWKKVLILRKDGFKKVGRHLPLPCVPIEYILLFSQTSTCVSTVYNSMERWKGVSFSEMLS